MNNFLEALLQKTEAIANFLWGEWMIALLVGTGVVLTIVTGGIQIRRLGMALKLVFKSSRDKTIEKGKGDITPFAALMTALAATVGNGNIAGVATAIATGGPGAPFWMWISGFFGMATKYSEGFLGVKYRQIAPDGSMLGGPMYYCRYGIKNQTLAKALGLTFAVCGGFSALFGTGNMMQSNSMALAFKTEFGVPTIVSAVLLTILVSLVIIGGIKRIGAVAEKLVPSMIFLYLICAIIILISKYSFIDDAFVLIFKSAFSFKAAGGALIGTTVQRAISLGVRRGVLSNEAGLGTAAIAQSAASSSDPTYNGLIAMTGVFIDTILVNTLTTLTIVLTGVWMLTPAAGVELIPDGTTLGLHQISTLAPEVQAFAQKIGYNLANGGLSSTALTAKAFGSVIPQGGVVIAIASFLFGYTTIIGWAYFGEQSIKYLAGMKSVFVYRIAFIALIFIGAILTGKYLNIVWYVGDTANAIMAMPNLLGLLLLAGVVAKVTKESLFKD